MVHILHISSAKGRISKQKKIPTKKNVQHLLHTLTSERTGVREGVIFWMWEGGIILYRAIGSMILKVNLEHVTSKQSIRI